MSILQPYFYIPIADGIQHLNSQPAFAAGRGQGRDVGFYKTPEASRVNGVLGGDLFKPENSAYIDGYDGFQVQGLVDHSTFVGMFR